jgi:hypothetical protein
MVCLAGFSKSKTHLFKPFFLFHKSHKSRSHYSNLPTVKRPNYTKNTMSHVYIRNDEHSWVPALQLQTNGNKATVSVPVYKNEQDILSSGGVSKMQHSKKQVIDLTKYDNMILPMQNVDSKGALEDYRDMVTIPFLHEVRLLSQVCF